MLKAAALPGTYSLLLRCRTPARVRIGQLGVLTLRKGFYIYLGSAFGPGGICARVGHHCRMAFRPRWHMDYLRPHVEIVDLWCSYASASQEHLWARILLALPAASIPLARFGASDCGCRSHLYFFGSKRPSPTILDAAARVQ